MHNEIYQRTIIPAGKSAEGETPVRIFVTEEINCHIVWGSSHELGQVMLKLFQFSRNNALEYAILHAAADFLPMLKQSGEAA